MICIKLLESLVDAFGPSGNEEAVRKLIYKKIRPYVDELRVNKLGNLIAHKKGHGKTVMLAAHMDEIGLMVKKIDDNGFIRVSPIGGIEPMTLLGQVVKLLKSDGSVICNGVITFGELHDGSEIKAPPRMDYIYVDTGLTKQQLTRKGIDIGTYIIPDHKFRTLGDKSIITGKALDDRIGCYMLIKMAEKLKNYKQLNIYYVFTVQEEIGLYGAKTSVYEISPDWGIAVDTTFATDSDIQKGPKIGSGPYLTVKDSEIIANPKIDEHIKLLAKKNRIPLNLEVVDFGTTDATNIMLSGGGVPSTILSVPVRNLHTTIGVASMVDVQQAIKLGVLLLKNPPHHL